MSARVWTEPMEHLLIERWSAGDSIRAVAKKVAVVFERPITPGSIASKVAQLRRRGIKMKERPLAYPTRPGRVAPGKVPTPKRHKPNGNSPVQRGRRRALRPLLELKSNMCKWPVEMRNDRHYFCARAKASDHHVYCAEHAMLATNAWRKPNGSDSKD
jgi:hypothetical protein